MDRNLIKQWTLESLLYSIHVEGIQDKDIIDHIKAKIQEIKD